MGPILNGYHPASKNSNYVTNNITTNITCIVIRRVNHHVLLIEKLCQKDFRMYVVHNCCTNPLH